MTYNYTRPRRPVAATFNSPGPVYGLPPLVGHVDHDTRSPYAKAPAYSIGIRPRPGTTSFGPGPCKYFGESKSVYPSAPCYSLHGRPNVQYATETPDPAVHGEIWNNPTATRAPAYSFGMKYRDHTHDDTPGPSQYRVPLSTIESRRRRAPSHSIVSRNKNGSFHEDLQRTPGPGTYAVPDAKLYLPKPPQYSITVRHNPLRDNTEKPGPGAHHPEDVEVHKRSSPKFTFGLRHSIYEVPLIPAVENY